jgi:hypothetical protein
MVGERTPHRMPPHPHGSETRRASRRTPQHVGMRRCSACALVVVTASLLSACGGSGDGAGGSETTASSALGPAATIESTVVIAPPSTAVPTTRVPSTEARTTDAPTSISSTTTTTTTTPPTTAPPDTECLDGSWWLSPDGTTSLYAALLPGMPVTVTGTHWVEFSGGAVDYWAVLEAHFAVGSTDVTFGIDQHGVGSYSVAESVLTMTYDTFDSNIHEGHGAAITDPDRHPATYVGEAVDLADNGDGTITINRVTLPVIEIPPVAGGPMGCNGDTMSLGFTSGLADTAAVYVRKSGAT